MQASMTISQPWRPLLKVLGRSLGKSLAGLALATSIVGYGLSGLPSLDGSTSAAIASTLSRQMQQSLHAPTTSVMEKGLETLKPLQQAIPFLQDGTYLYGQSAEPEQVGSAYMIFDVAGQDILGAFYMPSSSFDCFQGSIQSDELALTIHDSYAQESFPFSVALVTNEEAIASEGTVTILGKTIDGFQPIDGISDNDQRILATCRADLL